MKRFFFVTGKGGVGKTTLSMAITKSLADQGKKALYVSFDENQYHSSLEKLKLPHQKISIEESSIDYIAKKIKSKIIAKTIVKTPFYKSLSSIVPGFDNIILLGKVYELLKDPELSIVLDAPATGHAMTTIESLQTFKKVFNQGIVFNDIQAIANTLLSEDFTQIISVSLPEKLVDTETEEFRKQLQDRGILSTKIINKVLSLSNDINEKDSQLPNIILKKIEREQDFLKSIPNATQIAFQLEHEMEKVVQRVSSEASLLI